MTEIEAVKMVDQAAFQGENLDLDACSSRPGLLEDLDDGGEITKQVGEHPGSVRSAGMVGLDG